ncbi:MAG: hypothetical protein V1740_06085 [Candidatus Woesearchaeota archaeon]
MRMISLLTIITAIFLFSLIMISGCGEPKTCQPAKHHKDSFAVDACSIGTKYTCSTTKYTAGKCYPTEKATCNNANDGNGWAYQEDYINENGKQMLGRHTVCNNLKTIYGCYWDTGEFGCVWL